MAGTSAHDQMQQRKAAWEAFWHAFPGGTIAEARALYANRTSRVRVRDLSDALLHLIDTYERRPSIAAVHAAVRRVRAQRLQAEAVPQASGRPVSPLELDACRTIRALGRRGIFWSPRERAFVEGVVGAESFGLDADAWTPPIAAVRAAWETHQARPEVRASAFARPLRDETQTPDPRDLVPMDGDAIADLFD